MSTRWYRKAAVSAVVVAALAGAGAAVAHGPGGGCGGGPPLDRLERNVTRAGLPPATAQAIYQRIDQARADRRVLESSLDTAHEQMRTLLDQGNANAESVMAQADTLGALETQLHKLGLRTLLDIRALVTPEQWEALKPGRRGGSADAAQP
jgi:Spy/CpxP family protein refolding chaperone